jgi:hypothetical protein
MKLTKTKLKQLIKEILTEEEPIDGIGGRRVDLDPEWAAAQAKKAKTLAKGYTNITGAKLPGPPGMVTFGYGKDLDATEPPIRQVYENLGELLNGNKLNEFKPFIPDYSWENHSEEEERIAKLLMQMKELGYSEEDLLRVWRGEKAAGYETQGT